MKTINQFIKLYTSILNGKTIISNNHRISSDGIYWFLDGTPIDTINNKKKTLKFIIKKCELAKKLATIVDEDTTNMYNDYNIIYDSFDGMILLVKNNNLQLNFIYMVSTYAIIEQIDKEEYTMEYNHFDLKDSIIKQISLNGPLSLKSKRIIFEKIKNDDISITQNMFYDMLFEGFFNYQELIDLENTNNQIIEKNIKYLKFNRGD